MPSSSNSPINTNKDAVQALAALQQFYTTFSGNNNPLLNKDVTQLVASDLKPIAQKNIDAVNTLLTSLMGSDATKAQTQQILTTASASASSTTVTQSSKVSSSTTSLSSYNTRVPYVNIRINGVLISPLLPNQYKNGDTPTLDNFLNISGIEVLFQDLELTMPIGGVESSIRGTLKLYSRTPIELLTFITDGLNEQTANLIDDESGLPVCDIVLGWNVADGTTKGQTIRSPKIQFLIMNIQMSDPGKTMGSEFILTLQDAGSAALGNTSGNLGILPDYPQKQLRLLIEKCLGLRLFTLDDLLQLGSNNTSIASDSSLNSQYQNETFFVNPKSTYLRLNSNVMDVTIKELCESIACRWYPVSNSNLGNAITQAAGADSEIESLRKSFQNSNSTQEQQLAFDNAAIKVANCSILIWVPFFPASIYTTSNLAYLSAEDFTDTGAFLLLPKYNEDISISQVNLPVIYGPGGSGIPYFYGGGQNVYQRLTQLNNSYNSKGFANLVGEVLDLTLNFSSLVAVMKGTYDEEVFWRQSGATLNPFSISKAARDNVAKNTTSSANREAALKKALLKANLPPGTTPEQALELFKQRMNNNFKLTKKRFKQSSAPRKIFAGDLVTTMMSDATGTKRSYSNPTSMSTFSFSKLQERIGTFLQFPLTIGMRVMGDPFLLRQGIGVFEVINYYPTIDGQSFVFNPLVSGVYMPSSITHRVSLGDYTTEIQAVKVPNNVSNTATQTYSNIISDKAGGADDTTDYAKILNDVMTVNLEALPKPGKLTIPTGSATSSSYKVSAGDQTQVLTQTILGNGLTTQMNAAFAQLAAINAAVQVPQTVLTQSTSTSSPIGNALTENQ